MYRRPKPRLPILAAPMVLLLVLSPAGCTRERLTDPEEDDQPLASETIGPSGGEVAGEAVVLSVPPGALDAVSTVSIHAAEESHPHGVAAQAVYRLEGIPEGLGRSIDLRIQAPPGKSASSTIFIGEVRESQSGGRQLTWYEIPCRDSLGWIVGELTRGPYDLGEPVEDLARAAQTAPVLLATTTTVELTYTTSHFGLVANQEHATASMLVSLAARMEAGFDSVWALGFHFGEQDTIWPLKAYIRPLHDQHGQYARYIIAPYGKGHFEFDPALFADEELLSAAPIHEVFHCAQDYYDHRPPEEWKTLNSRRIWLDEAASSWIEGKTSIRSPFRPWSLTNENYDVAYWTGLHPPRSVWMSATDYGYGMSSLIEYITRAQGEGRLREIYSYFAESQSTVEECLIEILEPPVEDWIVDYQRALALEQIYTFNNGAGFRSLPVSLDLNPGNSPWENTHSITARPFAAVWERWTITDDRPEPATGMVFRIDYEAREGARPSEISVLGLSAGRPPELLVTAVDSVRLGDLPALRNTYDSFVFFVSRPDNVPKPGWFDDSLPYGWEAELLQDADFSRFETAMIQLQYHPVWHDGTQQDYKSINLHSRLGTWTGHTYLAEWDSLDAGVRKFGEIRLTVDPDTKALQAWSLSSGWEFPDGDYSSWNANGTGMSLHYSNENSIDWSIEDGATCGVVSHIFEEHTQGGELWRRLTGFDCNDQSYLTVRIRDDAK